jgi:hypothetical protein
MTPVRRPDPRPPRGLPTRGRLVVYVLSVLALLALRAVSYATPPESLWIAGIYDGSDFDDQIQLLRYVAGTPESLDVPEVVVPAPPSPERVLLPDPSRLPSAAVPAVASRAPPAA